MKSFVIFIIKHQSHMPAILRNITILFVFLTLKGTLWAQYSKWDIPSAPKRCTVIIPSNVDLMLPTAHTYQIGFFIYNGTTLVNVGSATYSSQGVRIELNYDPQGIVGYKENQQLITLIRRTSDLDTIYGAEFLYKDDKNKFTLDGTLTVIGLRYATWRNIVEPSLCRSDQYEVKIPYGLKTSVNFGTNIRNHQDEEGRYIIDLSQMSAYNTYELKITSPHIKYGQPKTPEGWYVYRFDLRYFPAEILHARYEICPGEILTLPSSIPLGQGLLIREPLGTSSSLTIQSAGAYTYSYSYPQTNCEVTDTITVTYKSNCDNAGYPELINPQAGQEVLFTKSETIRVYDASMTKVSEFISPTIWKGTDQNGNILPPGLYFLIHEDGTMHDMTIMY